MTTQSTKDAAHSAAWDIHKLLQRKGVVVGADNIPAMVESIMKSFESDKDERIAMVNPNHPCYGVDLWMCRDVDVELAKSQGYIPFDEYAQGRAEGAVVVQAIVEIGNKFSDRHFRIGSYMGVDQEDLDNFRKQLAAVYAAARSESEQ